MRNYFRLFVIATSLHTLRLFVISLPFLAQWPLSAWQGRVFKADSKNVVIYSENTAPISNGSRLYIFSNGKLTGEGKVLSIMHTNIKLRLSKGYAIKGYVVRDAKPTEEQATDFAEFDLDLISATKAGNLGGAKKALDSGANANAVDELERGGLGQTVLAIASKEGFTDLVNLLLNSGANPEATNGTSTYTALMYASEKGHVEIAKALIRSGADVDANQYENHVGMTALGIASNYGHTEIVKLLIAARVYVNARVDKDRNALMYAVSENHIEIVKLLLAAGARINAKVAGDHTILEYARSDEAKQLLINAGAK